MPAPAKKLDKSKKDWIQTFTGAQFRPLTPLQSEICIEDIAHHLAHICRYTGAVKKFYSVAQHSVLVSREAEKRAIANNGSPDYVRMVAIWGMLHDASEAYIADIARPVKHQPEMLPYREIEKKLQRVIITRFGLPLTEPSEVTDVDGSEILSTEARDLMSPMHPEWITTMPGGYRPLPFKIRPWGPRFARAMFMARWEYLMASRYEGPKRVAVWAFVKAFVTYGRERK